MSRSRGYSLACQDLRKDLRKGGSPLRLGERCQCVRTPEELYRPGECFYERHGRRHVKIYQTKVNVMVDVMRSNIYIYIYIYLFIYLYTYAPNNLMGDLQTCMNRK